MSSQELASAGLLLVGHGTRSAKGKAECFQLAELVAVELSGVPVETCFLELTEPTIAQGIANLADQGVRQLAVMPLLLFAAGHAKQDIPNAVARSVASYSQVTITYLPHFGCQSEMIELSARKYFEAGWALSTGSAMVGEAGHANMVGEAHPTSVVGESHPTQNETALILVGRGSHDAEATAEMCRFTKLRSERTPVGTAVACFLAMAEPKLEATLANIAEQGWRRIVVQPHLLFHGDLLDRLHAAVDSARTRWPDREWRITEHLGPAPQLADLIAAQFRDDGGLS